MERIKRHWYQMPSSVRRPLVLTVGALVMLVGAIFWFLPGPGWAIIFVGLAILSTEFERADRLKKYLIGRFKSAAEAVKNRAKR